SRREASSGCWSRWPPPGRAAWRPSGLRSWAEPSRQPGCALPGTLLAVELPGRPVPLTDGEAADLLAAPPATEVPLGVGGDPAGIAHDARLPPGCRGADRARHEVGLRDPAGQPGWRLRTDGGLGHLFGGPPTVVRREVVPADLAVGVGRREPRRIGLREDQQIVV